jgi:hypothetical protein
MPDTSDVGTSLHDLALEALLTELVHEIDAAETSTYDQYVGFQPLCIILVGRVGRLICRADVCPEVHHSGDRSIVMR